MHPVHVVEMLYVGVLSMGIMCCMRGCYCPRPADLMDATPTLSSNRRVSFCEDGFVVIPGSINTDSEPATEQPSNPSGETSLLVAAEESFDGTLFDKILDKMCSDKNTARYTAIPIIVTRLLLHTTLP